MEREARFKHRSLGSKHIDDELEANLGVENFLFWFELAYLNELIVCNIA